MTVKWNTASLGRGAFVQINPININETEKNLSVLPTNYLKQLLADKGAVLLRSFDSNLETFTHLVQRTSSRLSLDPARTFHTKAAQKVDAGVDSIPLHLENGNFPGCPDLAWFLCEKAASSGSQTTLCDGAQVWKVMPKNLKQLFMDNDIVYTRRIEKERWQSFIFHQLPEEYAKGRSPEDITIDELESLIAKLNNVSIKMLDNHAIEYVYQTTALHRITEGNIAFANSLLGPSFNYEAPQLSLTNGEKINNEILQELTELCESVTEEIPWQNGDIAIIDNHRVMHGRRAILDNNRLIYNALSYY